MTTFNGEKLQGAKNINNVSSEVGIVFMRSSNTDWEFLEVPSTSNLNLTFDPTNMTELRAETRWTLKKVKQDTMNVAFDLAENAGQRILAQILWMEITNTAAWEMTITDREMTFDEDVIEFREISNDGNWVSVTDVSPIGWGTAYMATTDYEVEVIWNITRIKRVDAGVITKWETVVVTGTVNLNANETTKFIADYKTIPEVEIRVILEKMEDWTPKYRKFDCRPMTLNSTYVLPFLNAVTAWGTQNTSLQFDINENWEVDYVNEIL